MENVVIELGFLATFEEGSEEYYNVLDYFEASCLRKCAELENTSCDKQENNNFQHTWGVSITQEDVELFVDNVYNFVYQRLGSFKNAGTVFPGTLAMKVLNYATNNNIAQISAQTVINTKVNAMLQYDLMISESQHAKTLELLEKTQEQLNSLFALIQFQHTTTQNKMHIGNSIVDPIPNKTQFVS